VLAEKLSKIFYIAENVVSVKQKLTIFCYTIK